MIAYQTTMGTTTGTTGTANKYIIDTISNTTSDSTWTTLTAFDEYIKTKYYKPYEVKVESTKKEIPNVYEELWHSAIKKDERKHFTSLGKAIEKVKEIIFFHDWTLEKVCKKSWSDNLTLFNKDVFLMDRIQKISKKIAPCCLIVLEKNLVTLKIDYGHLQLMFQNLNPITFQAFVCKYNLNIVSKTGEDIPDWMKFNQKFYENYFHEI